MPSSSLARLARPATLTLALAGAAFLGRGLAQEICPLAYASKPGRVTNWTLVIRMQGDIVLSKGTGESKTTHQKNDMSVDYHTTEADAQGADGKGDARVVSEVAMDRMTMKTEQDGHGGMDVEMSAQGMSMAGVLRSPHADPQVKAMVEEMFAGPTARLRVPATGVGTEIERLGTARGPGSAFDPGVMVAFMQPSFPADGSKPAVGAHWKVTRTVPTEVKLDKELTLELEYELLSVKDGIANLGVTGKFEGKDMVGSNKMGQAMKLKRLAYDLKGTAEFNTGEGRLQSSTIDLGVEMDMAPLTEDGSGMSASMKMPTHYELARRE
ncbi:MAG: hypothetical protein HYZ53_02060, partial [Planctomycetes bacterium]|nr:hypothetical protein [Planctomycetota bacterium]